VAQEPRVLFANDLILFAKESDDQAYVFKALYVFVVH